MYRRNIFNVQLEMMTKISNKVVPVLFTFLIVPLRTLRGQFDTPTPAAKKAAICRSLYIPIIAEERERRDSVRERGVNLHKSE